MASKIIKKTAVKKPTLKAPAKLVKMKVKKVVKKVAKTKRKPVNKEKRAALVLKRKERALQLRLKKKATLERTKAHKVAIRERRRLALQARRARTQASLEMKRVVQKDRQLKRRQALKKKRTALAERGQKLRLRLRSQALKKRFGSKRCVFSGTKEKTKGGIKQADLMKNPKSGKIVSKKQYAAGRKNYSKNKLGLWTAAVMKARKNLGITGFCAVGGKSAQGKKLLDAARAIYGKK